MRYQAAAVQLDCRLGDRNYNLARAIMMTRKAVEEGAKLVVLPELFATGIPSPKEYNGIAEEFKGDTYRRMEQLSREKGVYIVFTFMERSGDRVYETAVLMGPGGAEGYSRRHFIRGVEDGDLRPGFETKVMETELGKVGLLVGYELEFPEAARAIGKADVACLCGASSDDAVWDLATRSRAMENGVWLVAANRVGSDRVAAYCGASRIVSPNGKVMEQLIASEGLAAGEIKTGDVAWARERHPYQRDLELSMRRGEG